MRIKKVTAALSGKRIYIAGDDDGRQWLGDGTVFYLMDERIDFTPDNTLTIMDVDPKKYGEYTVTEMPIMAQAGMETQEGEEELKPMIQVSVGGGKTVLLMAADGKLAALDQKYIQPVEDEGEIEFRLRTSTDRITGGQLPPVIAMYGNMFCSGIAAPKIRTQVDNILEIMQQIVNGSTGYVI